MECLLQVLNCSRGKLRSPTCWRTALRKVLGLNRLLRSTGLSKRSPRATAASHRDSDARLRAIAVSQAWGVSGPSHKPDLLRSFRWRAGPVNPRALHGELQMKEGVSPNLNTPWGTKMSIHSKGVYQVLTKHRRHFTRGSNTSDSQHQAIREDG